MVFIFAFFFVLALYNPSVNEVNLSNFVLLAGFFVVLLFRNVKFKIYSLSKVDICILLLFFSYLLINTLFFSINKTVSVVILFKWLIPFMFSIFLLNTIKTNKQFNKFINILIFAGGLASLYGCIQYFFGLSDYALTSVNGVYIYRALGAFQQANVFASFLVLLIPFVIYKIKNVSLKRLKLLNLLILTLVFTCTYLTYSRWALVSVASVFGVYFVKIIITKLAVVRLQFRRSIYIKLPIFLFLMLPILGFVSISVYKNYAEKIYILFFNRSSSGERLTNFLYALEQFSNNIFGYGLGNGNMGRLVDSAYVNLLIDTGLIGVILFLILLLTIFAGLIKRVKRSNSLANILTATNFSLMIFIINGLLETIVYNSVINFFLGIYIFILHANKEVIGQTASTKMIEERAVKKVRKRYRLVW